MVVGVEAEVMEEEVATMKTTKITTTTDVIAIVIAIAIAAGAETMEAIGNTTVAEIEVAKEAEVEIKVEREVGREVGREIEVRTETETGAVAVAVVAEVEETRCKDWTAFRTLEKSSP